MANVRGYKCDVCDNLEVDTTDFPVGWMKLEITTRHDHVGNGTHWDICSNRCLKKLGTERLAAEVPTKNTPKGIRSSAARVGTDGKKHTPQSHSRWHTARNDINPDCPFCIEEMESDKEKVEA